ncbi:MAG TPA: PIN domain-containing protein [Bryobacteraceae bacterium]|jgi:PIN domain nuclease of toxin-antitoxin system|nr:PIN domain-containing protein [Bryobacteraceae bacterium]
MLNLDTHILLFALEGKLRPRERAVLAGERWGISDIVLWEITKLRQNGRIDLGLDSPVLARAVKRLVIWPIDQKVCRAMLSLDFSSDPADELIAATSLAHGVPLLTRDQKIRKSKLLALV